MQKKVLSCQGWLVSSWFPSSADILSSERFWVIWRNYSFLLTLPEWKVFLFLRRILKKNCFISKFCVYCKFREVLCYTAKLQFPSHSAWVKSIPVSSPYTENVILIPLFYSNAVQSFTVILQQVYGFLFYPAKVKVLPFPCCKLTEVLFFALLPVFWGPARSYSS